jgi:hypothetical protein
MLPHVLRMQIKELIFAVTRLGANIPKVCDSWIWAVNDVLELCDFF